MKPTTDQLAKLAHVAGRPHYMENGLLMVLRRGSDFYYNNWVPHKDHNQCDEILAGLTVRQQVTFTVQFIKSNHSTVWQALSASPSAIVAALLETIK